MDMKKILQTLDNASTEVSSSEMQRLRNIVEGKGPLNRLTAAESMTVDHYSTSRTTITSPVLNVQEDARPSMIGKYFKAVEEELQESAQRGNLRTRQLAERVTTRLNELSTATLAGYKKKAGADASKADKEGDFKRGNKRFSGIVKATKKQFDNDTKQGVAEGERTMSRAAKGYEKYGKAGMTALAKAGREGAGEKKLDQIRDKYDKYDKYDEAVAGPEKCWPGHRKVGTQPGTGKNKGKRVNDCEKIGEATSAAQQAAIAIAKKKAGKK